MSFLIGAPIIPRTLKLLGDTVNVLMESAPPGLDLTRVRERFDVSIEHSTFQIEPADHRDQESIHH